MVGTAVTITGTNLGGATSVKFNGTTAAIGTNSATTITTTVPAGATTGTDQRHHPRRHRRQLQQLHRHSAADLTSFAPASGR